MNNLMEIYKYFNNNSQNITINYNFILVDDFGNKIKDNDTNINKLEELFNYIKYNYKNYKVIHDNNILIITSDNNKYTKFYKKNNYLYVYTHTLFI